jgi:hypothetical protein
MEALVRALADELEQATLTTWIWVLITLLTQLRNFDLRLNPSLGSGAFYMERNK